MRIARQTLICLVAAAVTFAAGCSNPNGGGVQDFGTITGRLLDDRTGKPLAVSPIYISVGANVVSQVDNQGGFTLSHVPIGKQTVSINAIGYQTYSFEVNVVKDQTSDAGYVRLKSTLAQ